MHFVPARIHIPRAVAKLLIYDCHHFVSVDGPVCAEVTRKHFGRKIFDGSVIIGQDWVRA
ncbi:MAG: hypothetical protein KatS3mg099_186 [Candidatus Parcubacteria bacterium]|nr:MAG: hypothetical protein KatS3mg099_186 [Candidatus Parcubacteria bacterium]